MNHLVASTHSSMSKMLRQFRLHAEMLDTPVSLCSACYKTALFKMVLPLVRDDQQSTTIPPLLVSSQRRYLIYQMASIPPNEPPNPYRLPPHCKSGDNGPVGIIIDEWSDNLDEWFYDHPGFLPQTYLDDGQPADGRFQGIWSEILAVTRRIMNKSYYDPMGPLGNMTQVRRQLRTVVERAGDIKNAVCLGLGSIHYKSPWDYNHHYVQQCGVFFAICQMIEKKQKMERGTLPVIFQDPAFQIEDRFILEQIGGQTIVRNPEANNHMNSQSFVYAPHSPANYLLNTILRPGHEPELLYTNTIHGSLGPIGWLITDSYLKKVYWTRDATINQQSVDMYNAATRFLETREGIVYWGDYAHHYKNPRLSKILRQAFSRSSFYVRKPQQAPTEESLESLDRTLDAKIHLAKPLAMRPGAPTAQEQADPESAAKSKCEEEVKRAYHVDMQQSEAKPETELRAASFLNADLKPSRELSQAGSVQVMPSEESLTEPGEEHLFEATEASVTR